MQKRKHDRPLVVILSQILSDSLRELGSPIPIFESEAIGSFIARAMSGDARDYHLPEHAIDVAVGLDPLPRLAALFHDVVYLQVDGEQGSWIREFIAPADLSKDYTLNVPHALQLTQDRELLLCASIFGVQNAENLSASDGLNEFLSAVVFYKSMSAYLSQERLIQGVACIESTIPFRGRLSGSSGPRGRLRERLESTNLLFGFGFDENMIEETLDQCEKLATKDISFVGTPHPKHFLSDSWKLIYEQNPALRSSYFSVVELRKAVLNQFQFISKISAADFVWRRERADARFYQATENNLHIGRIYLQSQLLSLSIIEAVALATGGDAPWELFYGSRKKSREDEPLNLDELLVLVDDEESESRADSKQVYALLKNGRSLRSRFDSKTNRLAAYLYANLSEAEFNSAIGSALGMFQRLIKPEAHLRTIPQHVLQSVLMGISQIAQTRMVAIETLQTRIEEYDEAA